MTNLISHGRPMAELLAPRWKSQAGMYQTEFAGMTREPVTLEQLEVTREALLSAIRERCRTSIAHPHLYRELRNFGFAGYSKAYLDTWHWPESAC